jgi:uncharacterized protein with LGFP repeats
MTFSFRDPSAPKLADRFLARTVRAFGGRSAAASSAPPEPSGSPAATSTAVIDAPTGAAADEVQPGHDRRSFLTRVAVVGSVLTVDPLQFIFKPGSAYAALCGTCSDGWTAFCCTINSGRNSCPSGSFVAGWWKADNAAYCCGQARYIIDCNAICPTSCSCRCSGASCDGRRVCCNQFRYGQCHQEIACYGPVVCRVATCTPPWQYDASCTTTSATDNATVTHGAPCLDTDCLSDIERLYRQLGGADGLLGPVITTERQVADRSGRYAKYEKGFIFQRNGKPPRAVWGTVRHEYGALGLYRGELGYPTNHLTAVSDGSGYYQRFEGGSIYVSDAGTHGIYGGFSDLYKRIGGALGPLGYPTDGVIETAGGVGRAQIFQQGGMWFSWGTGVHWVRGAIYTRYRELGGSAGSLGFPTSDTAGIGGGALNRFENGAIYSKSGAGTHVLTGTMYAKYRGRIGEARGVLGFPTSDRVPQGDGYKVTFEKGEIAFRPGVSLAEVHGRIVTKWRQKGAYGGPLGWPIKDTETLPDTVGRRSRFDGGAVYTQGQIGVWEVHGPIYQRYRELDETTGSLGYPRSDVVVLGDGRSRVTFEHGTLTYDPDTGDVTRT